MHNREQLLCACVAGTLMFVLRAETTTTSVENVVTTAAWQMAGEETKNAGWWRRAVIYQIYPRSFMDSNNDGVGDLRGVIDRIDYLLELGVTALWLSPIYASPMADFGYDVSNYRAIDPIFGTMDDFDELLRIAHEKSLRVILDFIPNHSSDQHEWFRSSCAGDEKYKDFYVWRTGRKNNTEPPNNWISHFAGATWTYHAGRNQWYLHQYSAGQPDLNYRHAPVVAAMTDVMRFWLARGVDGLRVDAAPSLYEHARFPSEERSGRRDVPPTQWRSLRDEFQRNRPQTYQLIYAWRKVIDDFSRTHGAQDEKVMITESAAPLEQLVRYYGHTTLTEGTQLGAHLSFNFWFLDEVKANHSAADIAWVIRRWESQLDDGYTSNWVLGNHDNHRLATRFTPPRSIGMILLQMFLPGVAVTYQGEEIGMEDGDVAWAQGVDPRACGSAPEDFPRLSRDFARTPFHWDGTINAGFNAGADTWLPVSEKHNQCNVALQRPDPSSHLNMYKEMVAMRREKVLAEGTLDVGALSPAILQVIRRIPNASKMLLMNISGTEHKVDLAYQQLPMLMTVELVCPTSKHTKGQVVPSTTITLQPYEAIILRY